MISWGPKKIYAMLPIERKGPNGTANFMPLRVWAITANPVKVPTREDVNIVKRTPCQPMIAPIIASNLMSPPPIPSFFVIRLYVQATRSRLPPPAMIPSNESKKVIFERTKLAARQTGMPGRVIRSGMIRWSRSMKVTTNKLAINAKYIISDNFPRQIVLPTVLWSDSVTGS